MIPRPFSITMLFALLVASSLAMALQGTALAQQDVLIYTTRVDTLPDDPNSPIWNQVPATSIALTPQILTPPRLAQITVSSVSVRTVSDGQRIAFRLEWEDGTRDAHATKPDEFRDAAAIMFPVGTALPNICMGTPDRVTNIWHWKADWQEDIDRGFYDVTDAYPNFYKDSYPYVRGTAPYHWPDDFANDDAKRYHLGLASNNPLSQPNKTSPVEELIAGGFGTATHDSQQTVTGRGTWADGRWRAVFTRELTSEGAQSTNFSGLTDIPVAFAVWNGSNQEVGARKQVSAYTTARLTPLSPVEQLQLLAVVWWPVALLASGLAASAGGWFWWRRSHRRATA